MAKKKQNKSNKADTAAPKKKRMGGLGKIILPVTLAITSFCTVYFLPRDNATTPRSEIKTHDTSQTHEDLALQKLETSFVTLEPFTVSIKGRSRILRLGITLEIPKTKLPAIDADNPKLRDAFMGYLSVLDMKQIEEAAFIVGLRAQLTRRAKFVLGENSIQNILITDFMVR